MKKIMVLAVFVAFAWVSALQAGDNAQPGQAGCPMCSKAQASAVCEKAPVCDKAPTCDKDKSRCPLAKTGDKQETVKSCCPMTAKASKTVSSRSWLCYAKQAQR